MIAIEATLTEPLTHAELEGVSGGDGPPSWWWLVTFAVSESEDFIKGIREGYNAA